MTNAPPSPFRQLQLNAAVATIGIFRVARIERLEFGKAGRNKALRRHAERELFRGQVCAGVRPVRVCSSAGHWLFLNPALRNGLFATGDNDPKKPQETGIGADIEDVVVKSLDEYLRSQSRMPA